MTEARKPAKMRRVTRSPKTVDALRRILRRSRRDAQFRRMLLEQPRRALEQEVKNIPTKFRIKFIEKDPGLDALVVLPDLMGKDLSERELDSVAGGEGTSWDAGDQATSDPKTGYEG